MDLLDEIQRFDHLWQILTRDIHPRPSAQSQADKNGVEFTLNFRHGDIVADLDPAAKFHPQILDHLHFQQAGLRRHLVISDAISVESARLSFLFEYYSLMPQLRQLRRAAQARRPAAEDGDALAGCVRR